MSGYEQVNIEDLNFSKENGLIPVIVQDYETKDVLMLAYANKEALEKTIKTGLAHYWSRSRGKIWLKGETSGNYQKIIEVRVDCDNDAIIYIVKPLGPACHTGSFSCFYKKLKKD
jgi:phosphoribosyl-AMP cyclohydrolase